MPLDHAKVRSLRIKRGLTLAQAAKAAKLGGRQRWSDIESGRKGRVTITTLDRMAAALGVASKDLLK